MNSKYRSGGLETRNCEDVLIVIEGDELIPGPCPPALLKHALAEREKIARWKQSQDQDQPPKPADDNGDGQHRDKM